MRRPGIIFILSAPSGSGKTTLSKKLLKSGLGLMRPISYTTRQPRPGEKDRRDYIFITKRKFSKRKRAGDFLECTKIYGEYYATPRRIIDKAQKHAKDLLLALDVNGVKSIRKIYRHTVAVFVMPPSVKTLKTRLIKRKQDAPREILKRFKLARKELKNLKQYNYVVINDNINKALERLKSIVIAERAKVVIWNTSNFPR
ncbi:MAG: guanylate kinase [Candidatus Omnitrophota bacterium]